MTKQEILAQLEDLGWEYIVDEFTHSSAGHRREHFERVITDDKTFEIPVYFVDQVLIFHYLRNGKHDEPTIKTSSSVFDVSLEEARNKLYRAQCCALNIEETQLFLEYMKILKEEDEVKDNETKLWKNLVCKFR